MAPILSLDITSGIGMGTMKYISKQTQSMRRETNGTQKEAETAQEWNRT